MKVTILTPIKDDVTVREMSVTGPFVGLGITKVELECIDFRRLSELTPEQLHEWFNRVHCRFY